MLLYRYRLTMHFRNEEWTVSILKGMVPMAEGKGKTFVAALEDLAKKEFIQKGIEDAAR